MLAVGVVGSVVPWIDLPDDQSESRPAYLRQWEDRSDWCKGAFLFWLPLSTLQVLSLASTVEVRWRSIA
jgi:hypothetical protein